MSIPEKLLPVILPSWPICENCLSWSDDDLAVAGGEFVHVLTPKSLVSRRPEVAGHPQWNVLSLRVNVFQQDEWPEQTLATITDFSIGEEQSNCHIVALDWSKAGLGVHRRSILGILTSNLVLSLWETSGSQVKYQRTCIVNHYLHRNESDKRDKNRRVLRVRSFAWLDPLKTPAASKWGLHFLVTADDNGLITFWQASKANSTSLGQWELKRTFEIDRTELVSTVRDSGTMSPLQKRLHEQSPITKLDFSSWVQTPSENGVANHPNNNTTYQSTLRIVEGTTEYTTSVCATISEDGLNIAFSLAKNLESLTAFSPDDEQDVSSSRPTTANDSHRAVVRSTRSKRYFQDVLQPLCDDFDRVFKLCGHLRVRIWGTATSTNEKMAAVCVTLHPSDMIEYTIPSTEKSTVVFKYTGKMDSRPPSNLRPAVSVYGDILQFAFNELTTKISINSSFDKKLIRTYMSFADAVLSPTSQLKTSLRSLFESLQQSNGVLISEEQILQTDSRNHMSGQSHNHPENCDICGASIAFASDTRNASCCNGHQFSRCQLCFVAIQEPGISKYCSQCGKQFLDLTKLGLDSGPSFARTVFDEFDVCPYCQAKFRD